MSMWTHKVKAPRCTRPRGFLWANCHHLRRLATCKQSRRQCLLRQRDKMKLCNPRRHPLSVVGLGGDNMEIVSQYADYEKMEFGILKNIMTTKCFD